MLRLIVATSPEGIIAIDGKMPWHITEDLKRFKRYTVNNICIYGRKTLESIGRVLPNRINYIISNTLTLDDIQKYNTKKDIVEVYKEIDIAIAKATAYYPNKDIYIIGGKSIYDACWRIVEEVELTVINKEYITYKGEDILRIEFNNFNDLFSLKNRIRTEYAEYQTYYRKTHN